jgi:hypothetical protein
LLQKSEERLLVLDFEQILNFLQSDLFEVYREVHGGGEGGDQGASAGVGSGSPASTGGEEGGWKANDFVRDAYDVRM